MPFSSNLHWHALTKPSLILEPMLRYIQHFGIKTIFIPSLGYEEAMNHKRIRFNSNDLPELNESNFPLFAYSRSPLVCSSEANNFRRIAGETELRLNNANPFPINYAMGNFQLNWLLIFNNITDLEEFEVVYTTEKFFSNFRDYKVFIPPLYCFANLTEQERSISVGSEWTMFDNLDLDKMSNYVHFSVGGTASITFPALSISDKEISFVKLQEIFLGFYSSLDFREDTLYEKFHFYRDSEDNIKADQIYKENRNIF